MKIVGIHAGHDSNVCVLNHGKVEKYLLTERFSGEKHDSDVKKILPDFIKSLQNVDHFLVSGDSDGSIKQFIYDNYTAEYYEDGKLKRENIRRNADKKFYVSDITGHHRYHAELAYWNSGFDKSIVIVADGQGALVNPSANNLVESESVYVYDNGHNSLLYKSVITDKKNDFDSIDEKFEKITTNYVHKNKFGLGSLYNIASVYMGGTHDECGKAMGLSSYGEPTSKYKFFLKGNNFNNEYAFKNFDRDIAKEITNENFKKYADFCYEVQRQTEKVLVNIVASVTTSTGIKKVCISGGYAMNIVSNYNLTQKFPDVQFYFEPMCGDGALSIGYSMYTYFELNNVQKDCPCGGIPEPMNHTFYHGYSYENTPKGEKKEFKDIAKLLQSNKSVAIYSGLAEGGQRALGNRSILFNALNPDAKDIVNKIKNREWYRPFAAVVLEEDAHLYFDNAIPNKFMTMHFPVKTKGLGFLLKGVTHVDKTCRVQTVSEGYLYEILQEFKKLTGHGVLLNTSLNLAGDPLVETPDQAISVLENSTLDHLWFADTGQMI